MSSESASPKDPSNNSGARYAIYFAPEAGTDLARFGNAWLGRDPVTGKDLERPPVTGLDQATCAAITATPRRYGFHATLKAPFRPRSRECMGVMLETLAAVCARHDPFPLRLELADLRGFLALCIAKDPEPMNALAADLVRDLDGYRASLTEAEIAKRRPDQLSPRRRAYLETWGYPYVFEEFTFHMTLTDRLDPEAAERARNTLADLVTPVTSRPVPVRSVCLFSQRRPDADFRLVRRFSLGAATQV